MTSLAALGPIGTIGRYEIIGRLATGGMAEIFLARETGRHATRLVVVKRILPHIAEDPVLVEMFLLEARLSMNLAHPNICPIYELGDAGGRFFLAMEWVRGISLRALIDRAGPLPIPFVAFVFAEIAAALHHAHTWTDAGGRPLSIVHRDVNPDNIMIGWGGVAKLLDFGVAKAATQKHKTEAGNVKGKFAYISPEQYQGQPLDGRSDVFSLGVTLYEALTGESPYERASEFETVAAIVLDAEVPSVRAARPEVPDELEAIVASALAKDRDARTADADELARQLLGFASRTGGPLRHADVAQTLRALVPDLVDREPELDRRPLAAPEPKADPVQAALLMAEADEEAEALLGARRRSGRWVALVSVLVILASLGVLGWVVTRPPASTPAPAAAP